MIDAAGFDEVREVPEDDEQAMRLRAALCEAAVAIRGFNREASALVLEAERDIAAAMRRR